MRKQDMRLQNGTVTAVNFYTSTLQGIIQSLNSQVGPIDPQFPPNVWHVKNRTTKYKSQKTSNYSGNLSPTQKIKLLFAQPRARKSITAPDGKEIPLPKDPQDKALAKYTQKIEYERAHLFNLEEHKLVKAILYDQNVVQYAKSIMHYYKTDSHLSGLIRNLIKAGAIF